MTTYADTGADFAMHSPAFFTQIHKYNHNIHYVISLSCLVNIIYNSVLCYTIWNNKTISYSYFLPAVHICRTMISKFSTRKQFHLFSEWICRNSIWNIERISRENVMKFSFLFCWIIWMDICCRYCAVHCCIYFISAHAHRRVTVNAGLHLIPPGLQTC